VYLGLPSTDTMKTSNIIKADITSVKLSPYHVNVNELLSTIADQSKRNTNKNLRNRPDKTLGFKFKQSIISTKNIAS